MYQTIIFPDFDKLDYLPLYQKKYIDEEKKNGSFLQIEDMEKDRYLEIYQGLKMILSKEEYALSGHFNEILYLLGVIPKVATCFFAKWPHLSVQSVHSVSPESVHSADFKAF